MREDIRGHLIIHFFSFACLYNLKQESNPGSCHLYRGLEQQIIFVAAFTFSCFVI